MPNKKHPCLPRRRYETLDSVQAAIRVVTNKTGKQYYVEPCSKCNGYHASQQKVK